MEIRIECWQKRKAYGEKIPVHSYSPPYKNMLIPSQLQLFLLQKGTIVDNMSVFERFVSCGAYIAGT